MASRAERITSSKSSADTDNPEEDIKKNRELFISLSGTILSDVFSPAAFGKAYRGTKAVKSANLEADRNSLKIGFLAEMSADDMSGRKWKKAELVRKIKEYILKETESGRLKAKREKFKEIVAAVCAEAETPKNDPVPSSIIEIKPEPGKAEDIVVAEPEPTKVIEELGVVATVKNEPKVDPQPKKKYVRQEETLTPKEQEDKESFVREFGINTFYGGYAGEKLRIVNYYPKEKRVHLNVYQDDGKFIKDAEFTRKKFEAKIKDYHKIENFKGVLDLEGDAPGTEIDDNSKKEYPKPDNREEGENSGELQSIEEDFSEKYLFLTKMSIKDGKTSEVEEKIRLYGKLSDGKKIEVGKKIELANGSTSNIKSIKKEADGTYVIETSTSLYKLEAKAKSEVNKEEIENEIGKMRDEYVRILRELKKEGYSLSEESINEQGSEFLKRTNYKSNKTLDESINRLTILSGAYDAGLFYEAEKEALEIVNKESELDDDKHIEKSDAENAKAKVEAGAATEPLKPFEQSQAEMKAGFDVKIKEFEESKRKQEQIGELRKQSEEQKAEMESAEKTYLAKKEENEVFSKKFWNFFKTKGLGQAHDEEEKLRAYFEESKNKYEKIIAELAVLEAAVEVSQKDREEIEPTEKELATEIEKEVATMSEQERKKTGIGLRNIGFYVEEFKNKSLAYVVGGAAKALPGNDKNIAERGTFARFLVSLGENFEKDAQKSRENINKINAGESKKLANVAYFSGNIIRLGRVATDFTSWAISSPTRYWMMAGMALSKGFGAAEEARMKSKEVIDKTRIQEIDEAAKEAWKIYEQAEAGKDVVSKEDLQKSYLKNIPADLLKRLNKESEGEGRWYKIVGLGLGMIKHCVIKKTEGINAQIEAIDKNDTLPPEEREKQKEKIFAKYAEYLSSFDRVVSQYGTIDGLSMAARYSKNVSKIEVYALTAETLAVLAQKTFEHAPDIVHEVEKIMQQNPEMQPIDLDTINMADGKNPFGGIEAGGVLDGTETPGGAQALEQAEKTIDLPVAEGRFGGLEKTISDYYKLNPDLAEKYNALQDGGHNFNSGQIAHRIAEEYALDNPGHDIDRIPAGAHIEISQDGLHVKNVSEWMPAEHAGAGAGHAKIVEKEQILDHLDHKTAIPADVVENHHLDRPGAADQRIETESFDRASESLFGRSMGKLLNDYHGQIADNENVLDHNSFLNTLNAGQRGAINQRLTELGKGSKFFEDFRGAILGDDKSKAVSVFRDALEKAGGGKWSEIKGMTLQQAAKNGGWRTDGSLNNVVTGLRNALGEGIRPDKNETMAKWTLRVSQIAWDQSRTK